MAIRGSAIIVGDTEELWMFHHVKMVRRIGFFNGVDKRELVCNLCSHWCAPGESGGAAGHCELLEDSLPRLVVEQHISENFGRAI